MKRTRNVFVGSSLVTLIAVMGIAQYQLSKTAAAQAKNTVQAPRFEVDPMWPKPLPNHWLLGMTIGVGVDNQDHIYIIHRGQTLEEKEVYAAAKPAASECCLPAPPILEFDTEGNLIKGWGGPGQGYEWPGSNHGITPDSKGNLWIGGNGPDDGHILVFTREGKFVKQFGFAYANAGSNDMWAFNKVAKISLDEGAGEAYVADGYGNHRVAVIDMNTGKIKRYWGAYGNKPDDTNLGRYNPDAPPAQQFRNPVHCAVPSNDGLVYVCDRPNNRIQVFTKDGKFQKETVIAKNTLGDGAVWDVAFSRDPQQKYLYLADGANEKIYVIDRASMTVLTTFGDGGRQPGQFYAVHSIATDSKGNIYTTETYRGQRVQKFVFKGLGPVTKQNQGTVWPVKTTTH